MPRRFDKLDRNTRQYRLYNAVGRQIKARLITPSDNGDPATHFLVSVNDLIVHLLRDVGDSHMVGITIKNQKNQNDKPIGISFRRKDQLSADVIWSVLENVSQSHLKDSIYFTMRSNDIITS